MPIIYKEESKQFYLHTEHTSYVMELYENHLIHSYWGSLWLLPGIFRKLFHANIRRTIRLDQSTNGHPTLWLFLDASAR